MKSLLLSVVLGLLAILVVSAGGRPDVPVAENLYQIQSAATKANLPIILVFDSEDCSFCDKLENLLLRPMLNDGELENRAILRKMDINNRGKITDFNGDLIRARYIVRRYQVYATPTVVVLDHEGEEIASPIVGFNNEDDYRILLDEAILRGQAMLSPPHNYPAVATGPEH